MTNTKWRFEIYDVYDYTGMIAQFEKMAEKGWLIEHIKGYLWRYKRIEPRKINFAITHFEYYTAHESAPDNGQSEFLEMCRSAGWQLVAQQNSLMVFVNYSDNPVPLETDAITQVKTVHKSVKSQLMLNNLAVMAIYMLYMISNIYQLLKKTHTFVNYPVNFFVFVAFLTYIFIMAAEIFTYNKWHKKATAMAEETNIFLPTKTNRMPYAMLWAVVTTMLIPLITRKVFSPLFLSGIYLALVVAAAVYQHKSGKNNSKGLLAGAAVIVISMPLLYQGIISVGYTPVEITTKEMPVSFETLGISTDGYIEELKEYSEYKSILFDKYEGNQSLFNFDTVDGKFIEYSLVKSNYSFIMDNLHENYDYGWPQQNARQWNSDMVIASISYKGGDNYYIAYSDDMLLRFIISQPLTDRQIEFVVEQLVNKH